ncbi:MAG: dihydrofolate reductase family protein [Balneolaceae bacterium]
MNKIVYYVATSLDGYISGPNEDISYFAHEGNGVDTYLKDLLDFKTVIMGRKTYEFGFQFGLKPGQPAYPHMEHFIFSESLSIDELHEAVHIEKATIQRIEEIRQQSETDIYLCGGGKFAGWLLDNGMVDQLKLKINPIILGGGTKLFGSSKTALKWILKDSQTYDQGLQIVTYELE